jgi:predicted dehydrogenase
MKKIRTAAIGVGVQGQRHAQKLAALPASDLVAVVDADTDRARAVAAELNTSAVDDYRDLIGNIDAVALSTPTSTHYEIGRELLAAGIHILLEKPIATTVAESRELVRLAEEHSLVLQVGHLERFNPAISALVEHVDNPQFIESSRIAPYKPRALDVSVVLDLMIHDIDLIHSFVRSPMDQVDAVGRSVFSDSIDVANARIRFANGCIANVTSSRVSMKTERSLRIFQADSYLSADMQNKTMYRFAK